MNEHILLFVVGAPFYTYGYWPFCSKR